MCFALTSNHVIHATGSAPTGISDLVAISVGKGLHAASQAIECLARHMALPEAASRGVRKVRQASEHCHWCCPCAWWIYVQFLAPPTSRAKPVCFSLFVRQSKRSMLTPEEAIVSEKLLKAVRSRSRDTTGLQTVAIVAEGGGAVALVFLAAAAVEEERQTASAIMMLLRIGTREVAVARPS